MTLLRSSTSDNDLVRRYRANYGMRDDAPVTEQMIVEHWNLERALRNSLLDSSPQLRWEQFEQCYAKLYSTLPWLNAFSQEDDPKAEQNQTYWMDLIGAPPKKIYEVGSGKGKLIRRLASIGHHCRATEITRERGTWEQSTESLSWTVTDGVHLDAFESAGTYDCVISDQVIEHLHPSDIAAHFRSAREILKPNGKYIFATPHRYGGPWDVSRVMGEGTPQGMHLKEYTFSEIRQVAFATGFSKLYAVLRVPGTRKLSYVAIRTRGSRLYLSYLLAVEQVLGSISPSKIRRSATRASKAIGFSSSVFLIAQK